MAWSRRRQTKTYRPNPASHLYLETQFYWSRTTGVYLPVVYGCFLSTNARKTLCSIKQNIHTIWPITKSLQAPGLKHGQFSQMFNTCLKKKKKDVFQLLGRVFDYTLTKSNLLITFHLRYLYLFLSAEPKNYWERYMKISYDNGFVNIFFSSVNFFLYSWELGY